MPELLGSDDVGDPAERVLDDLAARKHTVALVSFRVVTFPENVSGCETDFLKQLG